jgi:hypothetical protein
MSNEVKYTNMRDKIMDKYWMEFLAELSDTEWPEGHFWWWFANQKLGKANQKLEDYL